MRSFVRFINDRCSAPLIVVAPVIAFGVVVATEVAPSRTFAQQLSAPPHDPGVRGGSAGAGQPLAGLSPNELAFFNHGKEEFEEAEEVDDGLGPRMNLDGCGGCHAQPAIGGSSPAINPRSSLRPGGRRATKSPPSSA